MVLKTSGSLVVRELNAADLPFIQALFKDVFQQELTDAMYAWKYRPGLSAAIGVFREGKLIAHYAGVGADILLQGKPARALQVVDVMVGREARSAVRVSSPFFLAASTFLQRNIGYQQPYLLGYGFPNERTMKLASHLNLYAPVGGMSELLVQDAGAGKFTDRLLRWRQLDEANWAQYAARIDALWQRMQQDLASTIVVRKDAAHIAYRYLQHPQQQYQLWLLENRLTGKVQALVVARQHGERLLLMDIVAPLPQVRDVLRLAAAEAQRRYQLPLLAWFSTAHVAQLAPATATVTALPISTPANIWSEGPAPEELHDRWWLTAGDTDFL